MSGGRDTKPLAVRLRPQLREDLQILADAAGLSRNELIESIVDHFLRGIPAGQEPKTATYLARGWTPSPRVR